MNANPQGLFPKITNLRLESQSGAPGSNTQNQLITMNVLKHSGGHISGMIEILEAWPASVPG
jgi:hypothetical protein